MYCQIMSGSSMKVEGEALTQELTTTLVRFFSKMVSANVGVDDSDKFGFNWLVDAVKTW